jgi:exosome complex component RRP43
VLFSDLLDREKIGITATFKSMTSSLSFPRATFAKLSPHPFLLANLNPTSPDVPPTRTNGRAPHEARPPQINVSSLSHAHGSAVVRTGDTTVICGVRGEVLPVSSIPQHRPSRGEESENGEEVEEGEGGNGRETEEEQLLRTYDLLVPNVELATGCAPQFLPGVPPTTAAQTMSTRVYELLHSCRVLRARDLRIWYTPPPATTTAAPDPDADSNTDPDLVPHRRPEVVAYWTLYIDLLFISYDGNPFDAAWAAVLAALRDTRLPLAGWDGDEGAPRGGPADRVQRCGVPREGAGAGGRG